MADNSPEQTPAWLVREARRLQRQRQVALVFDVLILAGCGLLALVVVSLILPK